MNGSENKYNGLDEDAWISEACTLALQLLVDLFVKFYDSLNHLLGKVLELLTNFIKQWVQSLAGIGVSFFVRLMNNAGSLFSDDKWQQVLLYLKTGAADTVLDCAQIAYSLVDSEPSDSEEEDPIKPNPGVLAAGAVATKEMGERGVDILQSAISDAKCHTAVQLLLVQVITKMYHMHGEKLSAANTIALLDIIDRKSTRLNSSHRLTSRMPSSA